MLYALIEKRKSLCVFTIFYVVIDGLVRMNETLIIEYELTQIQHTALNTFGFIVCVCVYMHAFVLSLSFLTFAYVNEEMSKKSNS